MAYTQAQKQSIIRQLAQLATMIEADHSVGFSLHVVFQNGDVTSVGGMPDQREHIDKLTNAMHRGLFKFWFFAFVGGAQRAADEVPPADEQN